MGDVEGGGDAEIEKVENGSTATEKSLSFPSSTATSTQQGAMLNALGTISSLRCEVQELNQSVTSLQEQNRHYEKLLTEKDKEMEKLKIWSSNLERENERVLSLLKGKDDEYVQRMTHADVQHARRMNEYEDELARLHGLTKEKDEYISRLVVLPKYQRSEDCMICFTPFTFFFRRHRK